MRVQSPTSPIAENHLMEINDSGKTPKSPICGMVSTKKICRSVQSIICTCY